MHKTTDGEIVLTPGELADLIEVKLKRARAGEQGMEEELLWLLSVNVPAIIYALRLTDVEEGSVAQLEERLPCKQDAAGSNPAGASTFG